MTFDELGSGRAANGCRRSLGADVVAGIGDPAREIAGYGPDQGSRLQMLWPPRCVEAFFVQQNTPAQRRGYSQPPLASATAFELNFGIRRQADVDIIGRPESAASAQAGLTRLKL